MTRWVCPNCGSRKNAPERPRRNDVRRYCLKCSEATGFLVERTAPRLERERAKAAVVFRERSVRRREADRRKWIVSLPDANGFERELDVRRELRTALTAMGFFEGWYLRDKPTIDSIKINLRRGKKPYHSGRAWGSFQVAFTLSPFRGSYEAALRVIYHEAAHLAGPSDEHHGARFHRLLAEALQKRWPWLVYGSVKPNQPGGCWAMGNRIDRQLQEYVRNGGEL